MENVKGIITLSVSYAAGVAAAALAAEPFAGALACSAAVALLLAACARSKGTCGPALHLTFFFLGAMRWCSAALLPPDPAPAFAAPLADGLANLLDRIPFAGANSGGIIKALLTGRRSGLPQDTIRAFRASGASHILALSGLHLGVIYTIIRRMLSPIGNSPAARLARSVSTVGICGLYALATGASASITRAFLYICINEAGRAMSGRAHSPLGTFCIALTIQLTLAPGVIATPGFQLSYLAMLGITTLYPQLESWYPGSRRFDPVRIIWKSAALSISCQAFTAPAAWFHFRTFPIYFLITNLIALPLSECIIISALAAAALEAICGCPPLIARACGESVQLLEFCLQAIASLPQPW